MRVAQQYNWYNSSILKNVIENKAVYTYNTYIPALERKQKTYIQVLGKARFHL